MVCLKETRNKSSDQQDTKDKNSITILGLYLFLQVHIPLSLATIKHKHFAVFGWGKDYFILIVNLPRINLVHKSTIINLCNHCNTKLITCFVIWLV